MKKFCSLLVICAFVAGCTTVNPYTGESQTAKSVWGNRHWRGNWCGDGCAGV